MILIPVKNLSNAKQRLAEVMDQPARTRLAQAMLEDVAIAVATCGADDACIVTGDLFAIELAARLKFEVMRDDANRSETDAIAMATQTCEARGIETTLVVPGDIPLIEAADIRAIYVQAPRRGSVLVPSSDERGTNAVLRRPAALFPLRFGTDSFVPHLASARAAGECVVLSLPHVALDIDTPEDLRRLAEAPGNKPAQLLARSVLSMQGI